MIVDKKGQIFEDRRSKEDRRKNEFDKTGGRREDKSERRQENNKKLKNK